MAGPGTALVNFVNKPTEVCTAALRVVVTTYNTYDVAFLDADGSPDMDPRNKLRVETALTDILTFESKCSTTPSGVRRRRVLSIKLPAVENRSDAMDVLGGL